MIQVPDHTSFTLCKFASNTKYYLYHAFHNGLDIEFRLFVPKYTESNISTPKAKLWVYDFANERLLYSGIFPGFNKQL